MVVRFLFPLAHHFQNFGGPKSCFVLDKYLIISFPNTCQKFLDSYRDKQFPLSQSVNGSAVDTFYKQQRCPDP